MEKTNKYHKKLIENIAIVKIKLVKNKTMQFLF